jgi:hypothetical protein
MPALLHSAVAKADGSGQVYGPRCRETAIMQYLDREGVPDAG